MIPRTGRRHSLNREAVYHPVTRPYDTPTVMVGGVRVSVYADTEGTLRISVNTDEDTPDPRLNLRYDDSTPPQPEAVPLDISVNGNLVYRCR